MPTFRIELRNALITNGVTKEVSMIQQVEAVGWHEARTFASRRWGVEIYDPAMFAVLIEETTTAAEEVAPSSKREAKP